MSEKPDWRDLLDTLADVLARIDGEGWLVGGCVRDVLLGVAVHDVDVAITGEPLAIAERMAQRLGLAVARLGHGTVRLAPRGRTDTCLDLTPLHGASIMADLASRDFTANAMAVSLAARGQWLALVSGQTKGLPDLIDPFCGHADILARRLIAVGPESFRQDAGRIVRAARLRARFGLRPDAQTSRLARAAVPQLASLSADRLRDELSLLLAQPAATDGIVLLNELGALSALFPGISGDTALHALATLRQLDTLMGVHGVDDRFAALARWVTGSPRRIALRQAVIAHAGEAHAEGLSPTLCRQAQAVLAIEGDGKRLYAARLLFMRAGKDEVGAADAVLVAAACALASDEPSRATMLAARADALIGTFVHHRELLIPAPLLSGKDLLTDVGISSGPAMGGILRAVRRAQLADEVSNRADALALARRLAAAYR